MAKPLKTDLQESFVGNAPVSVSALADKVKGTIEDNFGFVSVQGEIGRVARPASGHLYLDLKDDKASLSAVIWKGQALRLTHKPEEGLEAICSGRLTTFGQQSRYQLIIEDLIPAGKGALMALIEARRKKFAERGLFDEARKKPLPFLPNRIGVITSPSGAVIRDILHRLDERFGREVLVWGVQVQGEKCAAEVSAALDGFNKLPKELAPDLLIVARGGGSLEDLQGFNEEAVVLAASRSEIPVISAIGHETDHTLLDLVADKRAPTPTAAAEISVPVRLELKMKLQSLNERKARFLKTSLQAKRERLEDNKTRIKRAPEFIYRQQQRIDDLTRHLPQALQTRLSLAQEQFSRARLTQPIQYLIKHKKQAINHFARLLDAVSYQKVLERGFSLVLNEGNHLIEKAADTEIGQNLKIKFAHNQSIDVKRIQAAQPQKQIQKEPQKQPQKQPLKKPQREQGKLFDE